MASVKNKEGWKAEHTTDLGIEGKGTKRTRINPNGLNKKNNEDNRRQEVEGWRKEGEESR